MARAFKQLTARDRILISKLRDKKLSISEIAKRLGKDKSTISRELRRNQVVFTPQDELFLFRIERLWTEEQLDEYLLTQPLEARRNTKAWTHRDAQSCCDLRRWRANQKRRRKRPETRRWIIDKLKLGWSPQQIAGRSKIDGPEAVSHEYVYDFLHRDKKRGGKLYRLLKRFGKRKQRLAERQYASPPSDRTGIDKRPTVVDGRRRLGDCEADLIVGYRQSGYVLSVVDRRSRATVLRKLSSKHMAGVRMELEVALRQLGGAHTLTFDNGKEFYDHRELTRRTGVRTFFCHPYCSTERGSIENLNGLVRYYLPKRSSFARLSQTRLDDIQALLNNRPRRCLGYLTPQEVHAKQRPIRQRPLVAFEG